MKIKNKQDCHFKIYRYCYLKNRPKENSKKCKNCLLSTIAGELYLIKKILEKERKKNGCEYNE